MDDFTFRRFASKLALSKDCWLWENGLTSDGYGQIWVDGTNTGAHRASYEHFVGPLPSGLELDHLCRHRSCVNPAHLDLVTHAENIRRGMATQTHCRRAGHEYTPENTYRTPAGHRRCRACARMYVRP